ncbi:MAG: PD40 domain-containing protein [Muribaculaceae bacterium]|jgi:Tol biopolymer transport system component|nr:PD40 domain-containing protein [Muribaculaceae bacterium]
MKKLFISALLLCSGFMAYAQLVKVSSIEKVTLPEGVSAVTATMSPDGGYVVIDQAAKAGIYKVDLATAEIATISETGSNFELKIADDNKTVVYRESSIDKNRMRKVALMSANIATGVKQVVVQPSRDLQGFAVEGATVLAMNKGQLSTRTFGGAKKVAPVVSIDHGRMMLTVNGETKVIAPQGTESQSYLWPSISPDGTRIAYYLGRNGAYVCNLDGSNPVYLGLIRAPRWLDNNTVVGMHDKDNGHAVVSSQIIAVAADGSVSQILTDKEVIAVCPSVNADGSKIAFTTPHGELHIINVNK